VVFIINLFTAVANPVVHLASAFAFVSSHFLLALIY
jgi:hypothetical protein